MVWKPRTAVLLTQVMIFEPLEKGGYTKESERMIIFYTSSVSLDHGVKIVKEEIHNRLISFTFGSTNFQKFVP